MNSFQVSIYSRANDKTSTRTLSFADAINAIRTGTIKNRDFKPAIHKIRLAPDAAESKKLKTNLPGVTFSGTFSVRSQDNILQHSGHICLDFDHVAGLADKQALLYSDKHTYIGFLSPSGTGIKLVVKAPADATTHKAYFTALEQYYLTQYGLAADTSGKDVSRLCFLSYDAEIFVNEHAEIFQLAPAAAKVNISVAATIGESTDAISTDSAIVETDDVISTDSAIVETDDVDRIDTTNYTAGSTATTVHEQVEHCILQIEEKQLDITAGYDNWLSLAFALANEFGIDGRGYYQRLSMYYPGYDAKDTDSKYANAVTTNNGKITIRTFFDACKKAGINIKLKKALKTPQQNNENNAAITKKYAENNGKTVEKNVEKSIGKGVSSISGGNTANTGEFANPFVQVENYLKSVFDFRLNNVNGELEYKTKASEEYEPCKDESIYVHLQRNSINFSQNKLRALLGSDFVELYEPFNQYFGKLPVYTPEKQPDYITELCTYVKAKDQDRFNRNLKKMLVRSIACALLPDVFNKQAFILVHNKQNSGKSTFCRWLCPPALKKYYSETFNGDKDSMIALSENFIINLDELASLQKIELNALKTAISKDNVKLRRPYDKRAYLYPRRANFVGSTNDLEFLTDKTGNVRWLCFEIEKIDFNYSSNVDINNIWSQAYYLFKKGFDYQLTSSELLENEANNDSYKVTDAVTELIQKLLEQGTPKVDEFMTTTEVHEYLREKSLLAQSHTFNNKNIGVAMASLGYQKYKEGNSPANQRWGYWLKKNIPPFIKP